MKFNEQQQFAIEVRKNAVICAGAGSGKTAVLVERYIDLLAEPSVHVENILSLTFTRKASQEMKTRIYKRLHEKSMKDNAYKAYAHAIGKAAIYTFDAFCYSIVKQHFLLFGFPSASTIVSNSSHLFYADAIQFVHAHIQNDVWRCFVAHHGIESIATALASIDEPELTWGKLSIEDMIARQKAYAVKKIDDCVRDVLAGMRALATYTMSPSYKKVIDCSFAIWNASYSDSYQQSDALLRYVAQKHENIRCKSKEPEQKELYTQMQTNAKEGLAWFFVVHNSDTNSAVMAISMQWMQKLANLKRMHGNVSHTDIMYFMRYILQYIPHIANTLRSQYRYIMIDEFQDNNQRQKDILYLLAAPARIAVYDHIPRAVELETDKLFFVGDEKQSIYRFRGADVSVFTALSNELAISGGCAHELTCNYRSVAPLVTWINETFIHIMPASDDKNVMPYEASFTPMLANTLYPANISAVIEMHSIDTDVYDAPDAKDTYLSVNEAQAFVLARKIKQIIEQKTVIWCSESGKYRPCQYNDIAILYAHSTQQVYVEHMLDTFAIPYQTDRMRNAFNEVIAYDMYTLISFVLDATDYMAYAAYLHSPFVGMDIAELGLFLEQSRFDSPFYLREFSPHTYGYVGDEINQLTLAVFWESNWNAYSLLSEHNQQLLLLAFMQYQNCVHIAKEKSAFNFLCYAWDDLGYRFSLLSQVKNQHYIHYFDYYLTIAQECTSMVELRAVFNDGMMPEYRKSREQNSRPVLRLHIEGVQMMTVHAAKGLEFPIIFLAYTAQNLSTASKKNNSKKEQMPFYVDTRMDDAGMGLVCTVPVHSTIVCGKTHQENVHEIENDALYNPFVREQFQRESQEVMAEQIRVLYVAITRAQQHLYIIGHESSQKPNEHETYYNIIKKNMPETTIHHYKEITYDMMHHELAGYQKEQTLHTVKMEQVQYKSKSERLYLPIEISATDLQEWVNTARYQNIELLRGSGFMHNDEDIYNYDMDEHDMDTMLYNNRYYAQELGSALHECLAYILLHHDNEADALAHCENQLRMRTYKHVDTLLNDTFQLVKRCMDMEVYQLARNAQQVYTEYAFIYMLCADVDSADEQIYESSQLCISPPYCYCNGVVDAIFVYDDKVYIVDFKTDFKMDKRQYRVQLSLYAHAVEELFNRPVYLYVAYIRHKQSISFQAYSSAQLWQLFVALAENNAVEHMRRMQKKSLTNGTQLFAE